MPNDDLSALRARSTALFEQLLAPTAGSPPQAPASSVPAPVAPGEADSRPPSRRFRWFDRDDALRAAAFSLALGASVAAADTVEDGLGHALDLAEERASTEPAGLVTQGLSMFVTHSRAGRQLAQPRALRAAPHLFAPSTARAAAPSHAPVEEDLAYWREDPFANEHHRHWHLVYPYVGLAPTDWDAWGAQVDPAGFAVILEAAGLPAGSTARDFTTALSGWTGREQATFLQELPAAGYRALMRLNDRQGELFCYMHAQMLARYDTERISIGLERVDPLGPDDWAAPIPGSYDPGPSLPRYATRPANATLSPGWVAALTGLANDVAADVAAEGLREVGNGTAAITSDLLGEAVESSDDRLSGLDETRYTALGSGMHNLGHGLIGALSPDVTGDQRGDGVMNSPSVAIRDPVFWRWHRFIDDVHQSWQGAQAPYDLAADAPPVVLRNELTDDGGSGASWASPDLVLLATAGLDAATDPAATVATALGGDRWDTVASVGSVGDGLSVVDQLITRTVESKLSDGSTVRHLTHDPFALAVRVRNTAHDPASVTLRTFLVHGDHAEERGMWIELDKMRVELSAGEQRVVYRPDTEFSVVKKKAETDPQSVLDGDHDPNDPDYCDCGWPYTLLLPRGTPAGAAYRLAVVATDAVVDEVRAEGGCGSMSFCGAVDRYPDTRDMGYPFSRAFATTIDATIRSLPTAAGRSLSIRHV